MSEEARIIDREGGELDGVEIDAKTKLFDADPNCEHTIVEKWSGIECSKCHGWFCF